MTALEFLESFSLENLAPVYFLYGEEDFFHTEILRLLTGKMVPPESRDFNLEKFEGKTSSPSAWLEAVKTFSFFGGEKLVIVRNLEEASLSDKETKALLDYFGNPVAESCLVLTALKADRKRKLFKSLTSLKGAVQCTAPSEAVLFPWLKNRAASQGYTLSMAGAKKLMERIGPRPGILAGELEKMIVYAGKSKQLGPEIATEVVGESKLENVFAMTDALNAKNVGQAIRLLRNQMDHGEEPVKILGMIIWQFRTIWTVKHYQEKKILPRLIAEKMGARPFMVEKALQYTRNFTRQHLRNCFKYFFWADRELKTTGKNPEGILEALVLKLCSDSG